MKVGFSKLDSFNLSSNVKSIRSLLRLGFNDVLNIAVDLVRLLRKKSGNSLKADFVIIVIFVGKIKVYINLDCVTV